MMRRSEQSFGIIPLQKRDDWWALIICQRGAWGFPKGHPLKGESARKAAERELTEETGLKVDSYLPITQLDETYTYQSESIEIEKRVEYFPALVSGRLELQIDEVENAIWLPMNLVRNALHYPTARRIWDAVAKELISSK